MRANNNFTKRINRVQYQSIILYLAFLFTPFFTWAQSINEKPNIIIIFIDDMGYADVSSFGATDYQTPNIDRLADEGIKMTNFYASQAVCSASRASLLTGCYSERVGIQGALNAQSNVGINPEETLIPEMLKEQGYATGIFGKWHLGHHQEFFPLQNGFDEYVGLPYSNDMWPVGFDGKSLVKENKWKSNYPPLQLFNGNEIMDTIKDLDDQAKLTSIYTNNAVKFIDTHKDEPFFLYMPHSMVHVPIAVSDKFKGKSGKGLFADVMMELDWSVGEILETLKKHEIDDNTLIIFTSDNGPWLNFGNHAGSAYPLREGKGNMWEGGPRVSTMMRWPNQISAGTESNEIASTIDVLPTLSEITGAKLPEKKIDGISILPILKGEEDVSPRQQFYYYYGGELIAVRQNKWKLVFPHTYRSYVSVEPKNDGFPGPYGKGIVKQVELYDLNNDIGETKDLASQFPNVVAELKIIADTARQQLGDRIQNIKGRESRKPGRIYQDKKKVKHLAIGKTIHIETKSAFQYSGHGNKTLNNGIIGSFDISDEEWLGFQGDDFEAVIDMEEAMTLKEVQCNFMIHQRAWIFSPLEIEFLVSTNGKDYKSVYKKKGTISEDDQKQYVVNFKSELPDSHIRYIKVKAKNIEYCPDWHPGAGGKSWLFIDEIIIK